MKAPGKLLRPILAASLAVAALIVNPALLGSSVSADARGASDVVVIIDRDPEAQSSRPRAILLVGSKVKEVSLSIPHPELGFREPRDPRSER